MIKHLEAQLKELTLSEFPKEACALCTENEVYPIKNISEEEDHFIFCPIEFAKLVKKLGSLKSIKYLWHSHVRKANSLFDIRTPSEADLELFTKFKIPLLISGYDGNIFYPTVEFPKKLQICSKYTDRPYICGIYDCGTLIQDYYYNELGIELFYSFKPEYLFPKNWQKAVKDFLILNCFKEVKGMPRTSDVLIVPMLHIPEAHGVLVYKNPNFILDQKEVSRLLTIESYLCSPHKIYRFDFSRFKEKFL